MFIVDTFLMERYAPHGRTAGALTADDRLDIAELADRFDWAVDTRRYEVLAELFTADGVHGVQHWHLRRAERRWLVQRLTLDQTAVSSLDAPREVLDAVAVTADARAEATGRPAAA